MRYWRGWRTTPAEVLKKAQELWSLIEPFARYGFNKSHAVAYALVAYKTAYLKAHHPIDFFAANLSAEIGSTDGIVKVLGDCQESGIAVLPPHQRKGLGGKLLSAAIDAARDHGFPRVALTVHPENPAIALYEKQGFRKAGLRRTYHLMIRELG